MRSIAIAVLAVTSLWASWRSFRPAEFLTRPALARRLFDQADCGDDATARTAMLQLDRLGATGAPYLVRLMDADEFPVADAARRIVFARIGADDALNASVAIELAAALSEHAPEFSREAKQVAARAAIRLLARAADLEPKSDERARLIACCDKVLQATDPQSNASILSMASNDNRRTHGAEHGDLTGRGDGSLSADILRTLQAGALPLEVARANPPGAATDSGPRRRNAVTEQSPPIESQAESPTSDAHSSSPSGKWRTPNGGATSRGDAMANDAPGKRLQSKVYSDEELRAMFRSLSLREVMDRLHDPDTKAAAASELLARGLSKDEVAVATRMTSPDVLVRKLLVRELPSMRSVHARPWMFWLTEDDAPEVRLAALAELATTVDPVTRRRVIEIAERDSDRRVVRLAERLSKMTK